YYTTNRGATWTQISIPGVPTTVETGWGWGSFLKRHVVAADKATAGTFYLYNYGPGAAPSAAGIYRSTDGGATWTHVYGSAVAPFSGYNAVLKAVPGQAGHLFFTSGQQGSAGDANPDQAAAFMRSTDGGATWTAVPNVLEVYAFGFGQAAPGGNYPTVFIAGWVNRVYGVWRSDDNARPWTQIGDLPLGSLDDIRSVEGDKNIYGQVYIGFLGSGYAYGKTTGANRSLTVSASPSAGGVVSGGGTFPAGSSRTVTATANSGYAFAGWSENGNVVSTSASYTFTLNANRALVANFTATPVNYTISLGASPIAGGAVSGAGTFAAGSSRTVTATANSGYTFANWPENGSVISRAASYTSPLNAKRPLVANFTANPVNYTVSVGASPAAGGIVTGGGTFAASSSQTVTATANSGDTFGHPGEKRGGGRLAAGEKLSPHHHLTPVGEFSPPTLPPPPPACGTHP